MVEMWHEASPLLKLPADRGFGFSAGQLHQTGQANKGTTRSVIFVCDNVNCLAGQALQSSPCLQEQTLVFFYT